MIIKYCNEHGTALEQILSQKIDDNNIHNDKIFCTKTIPDKSYELYNLSENFELPNNKIVKNILAKYPNTELIRKIYKGISFLYISESIIDCFYECFNVFNKITNNNYNLVIIEKQNIDFLDNNLIFHFSYICDVIENLTDEEISKIKMYITI